MIPNIPPKLFSLSAVAFGYILIDDMTANEQNAVGNWLMLVAQVLSTNAFYRQVMQERGLEPSGVTESGKDKNKRVNNDAYRNNNDDMNDSEYTINMIKKMIKAMQEEINQLKKEL